MYTTVRMEHLYNVRVARDGPNVALQMCKKARSKKQNVNTLASDIRNACHMSVYSFMNSKSRLTATKVPPAAPDGMQLPQGIAEANIAVARHVYEALAAGSGV